MDHDDDIKARPVPGVDFPNLRHLLALEAVGQTGSLSAAAEAVHITQPALSQALAGLETAMGARLFERGKAGAQPTQAGTLALMRLDRLLGHIRSFCADVGRARRGAAAPVPLERLLTTAGLRALVAVVEHGSFPQAARALGLAQPTLLRAARQLEKLTGLLLFEKTSFGVRPSSIAVRLARPVRLAFHEWRQALADIAALAGADGGRTVIGAMPLARTWLVPHAVADFQEQHPLHRVSILEGAYENLLAGLLDGDVDFLVGALREAAPAAIVQEPLFDDPLAIIARAGHPLAEAGEGGARRLGDYPWVMARPGSPLRHQVQELFRDAGEPLPARQVECNSLTAARALLIEGDYLMLLSVRQARYELAAGLLVTIDHPAHPATRTIGISYRRDWRPSPAQAALVAHLKDGAEP